MTDSVFDEEKSWGFVRLKDATPFSQERDRDHLAVQFEISGPEAREALARQLSWSAVCKAEEKMRREVTKIQEEIDQLKRILAQSSTTSFARLSVEARIRELENKLERKSLYVLATSLKRTNNSRSRRPHFRDQEGEPDDSNSASDQTVDSLLSDIFFAHYVEGHTYWRAVHVRITRSNQIESERTESSSTKVQGSFIHFSKDALSHFQNCPLPPLVLVSPISRTHERNINLLAKGCFACSSPYIHEPNLSGGHIAWKKPKGSLTSALGRHEEPTPQKPVGSLDCFTSFSSSSGNIRNMCQKPCQHSSSSTEAFSQETIPRQLTWHTSSSPLSNILERSEDLHCGEMN